MPRIRHLGKKYSGFVWLDPTTKQTGGGNLSPMLFLTVPRAITHWLAHSWHGTLGPLVWGEKEKARVAT